VTVPVPGDDDEDDDDGGETRVEKEGRVDAIVSGERRGTSSCLLSRLFRGDWRRRRGPPEGRERRKSRPRGLPF